MRTMNSRCLRGFFSFTAVRRCKNTAAVTLTSLPARGYNCFMGAKKKTGCNIAGRGRRTRSAAISLAQIAMFTALMTAGAYIQIPLPGVPLTFQTVISVSAGLLLGAKRGAAAMAVYAFAGLVGLPVFSSGSGIYYVLKPSFGYILGFIAAAIVAGTLSGGAPYRFRRLLAASLFAMLADYILGIAYFIAVWTLSGYEGLWLAVVQYNIIYIPKDIVLCSVAAVIARHVLPVIAKTGTNGR